MKIKSVLFKTMIGIIAILIILIISAILVFIFGTGSDPIVSNDITELRQTIITDIPSTEVTWELVSWPDKTNTFPPPQDVGNYALLANFTLTSPSWFNQLEDTSSKVWLFPSIARPWLFEPYKQKMQIYKGHVVEVSSLGNCKDYSTVTVRSKRNVQGFVCQAEKHVLLYLIISGETPSNLSDYWE